MARLFDDGSQQYLQISAAPVTSAPVTLTGWFRSDDATISQTIVGLTGPSEYLYLQAVGTDSQKIYASAGDDPNYEIASTTTGYSANTWHHAAAVFASSTSRAAYLDAGGKGTDTDVCDPTSLNTTRIATSWGAGGAHFSGILAEICFYDAALTDLEIWQLWIGRPPWEIQRAHLVGLWLPFGDFTDRDYSRRGHHMTAYNGPAFSGFDPPKTVRAWRSNPQYVGRRILGREQPNGIWARPFGGVTEVRIPRHPAAYYDGPTIF